jgi:hypothetical protein
MHVRVNNPDPWGDFKPTEAAFANAPDSGGACPSCVTTATALNAAAVRKIAPTLCGSVTVENQQQAVIVMSTASASVRTSSMAQLSTSP